MGFATCQRLLLQLCQRVPQDSLPQPSIVERVRIDEDADVDFHSTTDVARSAASEGLTLILACRSVQRAEEAKVALLRTLDAEIARIEVDKGDGWEKDVAKAAQLRGNVDIVIEKLDLSSLKSVFGFATEISRKYASSTHYLHCFETKNSCVDIPTSPTLSATQGSRTSLATIGPSLSGRY